MADGAEFRLREATMEDARLLFEWVNTADSLPNKAVTRGQVDWPTHRRWLQERIADPGCLLEIIERDGEAVGQVRIEPKDGRHIVDIYVSPSHRRAGLARAALARALEHCPVRPVIAMVKATNAPSLGLFRSLGFREIAQRDDVRSFEFVG